MTQELYKPSQIANEGLLLSPSGKANYRSILRLIQQGKLKAKEYATVGSRAFFMVHVDEIERYNKSLTE